MAKADNQDAAAWFQKRDQVELGSDQTQLHNKKLAAKQSEEVEWEMSYALTFLIGIIIIGCRSI